LFFYFVMKWLKQVPPKPPKQGVWERWSYGTDIEGWTLRCGAFDADVRRTGGTGNWYLTINNHPFLNTPDLNAAKQDAERRLVQRIEAVLPAYEVIKARLAQKPPSGSAQVC
jgi:hypothetical protein